MNGDPESKINCAGVADEESRPVFRSDLTRRKTMPYRKRVVRNGARTSRGRDPVQL